MPHFCENEHKQGCLRSWMENSKMGDSSFNGELDEREISEHENSSNRGSNSDIANLTMLRRHDILF